MAKVCSAPADGHLEAGHMNSTVESSAQEKVRKYFWYVVEQHKLPLMALARDFTRAPLPLPD